MIVAVVIVVSLALAGFGLMFSTRHSRAERVHSPAYDERRAAENCRPLACVTVLPRDTSVAPVDTVTDKSV